MAYAGGPTEQDFETGRAVESDWEKQGLEDFFFQLGRRRGGSGVLGMVAEPGEIAAVPEDQGNTAKGERTH